MPSENTIPKDHKHPRTGNVRVSDGGGLGMKKEILGPLTGMVIPLNHGCLK